MSIKDDLSHKRTMAFSTKFTLVEFLVVIAILSILAAMLLPALISARKTALSVSCMGRQNQFYVCNMLYGDDFHDWLHPDSGNKWYNCPDEKSLTWVLFDLGYVRQPDIFLCPAWQPWHWSAIKANRSYGIRYVNTLGLVGRYIFNQSFRRVQLKPQRGMFVDTIDMAPKNENGGFQSEGYYIHPRHPQWSVNICFNDGNVKRCQNKGAYDALRECYPDGLYFDYWTKDLGSPTSW